MSGAGRAALVHNERVKLASAYLNGLAVALFAVGGIAPTVALVTVARPVAATPFIVAVCFVLSLLLHIAARLILGRLRDDGE